METHPHLHLFDTDYNWKYLIIGTFPPNTTLRRNTYVDYFYGNKGFLWKIIYDIYKPQGYDFFKGNSEENRLEIIRWQLDFCVGLTDTIAACNRKQPLSSDDADFTDVLLNLSLKDYLLEKHGSVKALIFTSSVGKNSAYRNFTRIMGDELELVHHKVITGLPSPSGSANISLFNWKNEDTLGLIRPFYDFVIHHHPQMIPDLEFRSKMVTALKKTGGTTASNAGVPPVPAGLIAAYKAWKYAQVLPSAPCR